MNGNSSPAMPHAGVAVEARWMRYVRLTRLDKPIGISLLLWPTLDALWLGAGGWPGARLVAIFTIGTVLTRSAGCAVNDLADQRFDAHVERTAARPLAQGALRPGEALAVALVLALLAAATLPFLRPAVLPLALIAVLVSVSYPFFKRFFPIPQAYLGIAFSFGIPMAYTATRGLVPVEGWCLFAANLFWVIAYDTEYAMVDRRDDLRLGLRSSAIFFGRADVLAVAICYGIYLAALAGVARACSLGAWFALGWCAALACAMMHLWWIRRREPAPCLRAFRHNHWLGLAIFAGIAADFALR